MKKIFLFAAAMIAAMTLNAQEWDFTEFDAQPGLTTGEEVINGLGFYACASDNSFEDSDSKRFGLIEAKEKTWKKQDGFEETFKGYQRVKTNGGAGAVDGMPIQRYFYFDVETPSTIQVWYQSAGSSSRYVVVSDGANETKSEELTASSAYGVLKAFIANAGRVYVYGTNGVYIWKITATPGGGTGIENVATAPKAAKRMLDGQVIIERDGRKFNLLGAEIK